MALNLRQTVINFLKANPEQRFTSKQIAEWIFVNHRDGCEEKRNQSRQDLTSDALLLQQLAAEISTNRVDIQRRFPEIKTTEGRPRHYFYSIATDEAQAESFEEEPPSRENRIGRSAPLLEQELYPILVQYLQSEGIYSKRIDERKSSNTRGTNGNQWLFPDLVGMEDLSNDWDNEIRECVKENGDRRARLWSFEVKRSLNSSTVRASWFQAVSNSSWANFGYLVTTEVFGENTMKELRMLSAAHGIGLIKLDVENPGESEILIPARERAEIDWDACNRLAKENSDFKLFIKLIRKFLQTGDSHSSEWDKVHL